MRDNFVALRRLLDHTRREDIVFYDTGRIDLTARVTKALGISPGDVVDIATDGIEYYLYVRHKAEDIIGRHEAKCYASRKGSHNMRLNSKRLCRAMLKHRTGKVPLRCGEVAEVPGIGTAITIITR